MSAMACSTVRFGTSRNVLTSAPMGEFHSGPVLSLPAAVGFDVHDRRTAPVTPDVTVFGEAAASGASFGSGSASSCPRLVAYSSSALTRSPVTSGPALWFAVSALRFALRRSSVTASRAWRGKERLC